MGKLLLSWDAQAGCGWREEKLHPSQDPLPLSALPSLGLIRYHLCLHSLLHSGAYGAVPWVRIKQIQFHILVEDSLILIKIARLLGLL